MSSKGINRNIQFKNGSYSVIITLIAIAIFIIINLAVYKLPSKVTTISTADTNYYDLTETTKGFLDEKLNTDIKIYMLSDSLGSYDEYINNLCQGYEDASDHIDFERIDVAVNPTFTSSYSAISASPYSVIVKNESNGRFQLVDYSDMYYAYTSADADLNAVNTYYYDGEGQITAAIGSIINNDITRIYQLTGHGESLISESYYSTVLSALIKSGCEFAPEALNLDSYPIPEDCGLLFIYNPLTDISLRDVEAITEYINNGGDIVVIYNNILPFFYGADYYDPHTNLNSLLANIGVSIEEGYVTEKDSSMYYSNAANTPQAFLLPLLNPSSSISSNVGSSRVLASFASALTKSREDISYTELIKTSPSHGVVFWNGGESYDVDYNSSAAIAAYVKNGSSDALIIGCALFFDDILGLNDPMLSDGNIKLLVNAVNTMKGRDYDIYVAPKTFERHTNIIAGKNVTLFSILYIGLIPLFVLGIGFVIWFIRRSK